MSIKPSLEAVRDLNDRRRLVWASLLLAASRTESRILSVGDVLDAIDAYSMGACTDDGANCLPDGYCCDHDRLAILVWAQVEAYARAHGERE